MLLFSNCFKNEGLDWIEFESMNVEREFFTLTTQGDKLLATGGYNSKGYVLLHFKNFSFFNNYLDFVKSKSMEPFT